ncbi:zeta toxin family protein [Microbacterium sp. NPDC089698]|uniref:zeta toxin family protein n=1 Tax=Microbacterium sp. NPDC089698 TaxID=3364200 RepID=UPI0038019FB4
MTLDEAWIHARFHDLIVPRLFARARPSSDPLWIGIGGQPGAGKTHGRDRALRLNGGTMVTAIIGDDLRAFHPDYQRLLHEDPLAMPAAPIPASARWVELALEHAREHQYNVLVEGTFRRPEITLGTARRFHDSGYRTHLVALAVPPWESQLSSLERFQLDHEAGLTARWTDPAAHDAGVRGTPITLDAAAASPAIDRISVVTRDGAALFDRTRPAALTHAADVLRALHQTAPTPAEHHEWELRRRDVVTYFRRELPHTPETEAADRALEENATALVQLLAGAAHRGALEHETTTDLTSSAEALLQRLTEISDNATRLGTTESQPDPQHPGEQHRGPSLP